MRPHLGHIKDVPLVGFGVLGIHDLDVDVPDGIVLGLDGLVQVLQEEVWVLSGDPGGFLLREVLDSLLGLDVHFDVFERAILIPSAVCSGHNGSSAWYLFSELVGMATVGVDLTERSRGSSVTEQMHELMDALGVTSVEARMTG